MKKLVVIVSLIFAGMTANAQLYLGGSSDFSTNSTKLDNGDKKTSSVSFGFYPEIGYYLTDRFDIGLDFGFRVTGNKNHTYDTKATYTTWRFAPYVRYSLIQFGNFELIGKGAVSISGTDDDGSKRTLFGINVSPIVGYNINDHFMLFTNLNFISFGFNSTFIKDGDKTYNFGFGLDANSLATLGDISIGCTYKF